MKRQQPHPTPTLLEEEALAAQGLRHVVGVDEVGRGPLAGPVVAAAAALPLRRRPLWLRHIRDSKALSPAQRVALYPTLCQETRWAWGMASSHEIDDLGIVGATRLAMLRAIQRLPITPDYALVDGRPVSLGGVPCRAIVGGDASCLSIAAASILAKVTRDAMMDEEEGRYPGYGFARHKGYGTSGHLAALRRLGPCPIHRRSFAPVRALLDGAVAAHG